MITMKKPLIRIVLKLLNPFKINPTMKVTEAMNRVIKVMALEKLLYSNSNRLLCFSLLDICASCPSN